MCVSAGVGLKLHLRVWAPVALLSPWATPSLGFHSAHPTHPTMMSTSTVGEHNSHKWIALTAKWMTLQSQQLGASALCTLNPAALNWTNESMLMLDGAHHVFKQRFKLGAAHYDDIWPTICPHSAFILSNDKITVITLIHGHRLEHILL